MTFPLITAQALKSLAGVVIFGLGPDTASFVPCQLWQLLSFAIREGIGFLFCGVLSGWQSANTQIFALGLFLLGCSLERLLALGSLAHFLDAVV